MIHDWDVRTSKRLQAALSGRPGPKYVDQAHKDFWEQVSAYGDWVYTVIMIGLLIVLQDHRVLLWLVPVAATTVSVVLLQAIVKRPRPTETQTRYKPILPTYSFPSNHAATSFAFATTLSIVFLHSSLGAAWLFAVAFFSLASLISLSRVVVGVHYFGDVAVGALLGIVLPIVLLGL